MKVIVTLTACLVAVGAYAAEPTPSAAPAAVTSEAPSPEAAAAAQDLLDAMHAKSIVDTLQAQMDTMFTKLTADIPLKTEAERAAFDQYREKSTALVKEMISWERMEPMMVRVYSKVYTADELKDIAAFYRSPAGQKMIAKMPQAMQESMQESMQMLKDVMPRIQQLAQELRGTVEKAKSSPN